MNNEPVFPSPYTLEENSGMTLRDYFAAKAMQALCPDQNYGVQAICQQSYELADAMMEARK